MEEIFKALELKQQLDSLRPLEKEQEARIMQKFRLDWNYHSNNLEGNSLTYGETKALILHGITAQGKPLKDHIEVRGHNDAVNWVLDVVKGERPLNESFIRELHEVLLVEPYQVDAQTPDGQPTKKWIAVGSYKSSPNHVLTKTGEMFYFATPEETPAKMGDLMAWYNEKIAEIDFNPILLAAEFHYKFIRIHPFDDGNGRTVRMLMNFILMKYGYPPVIIKTEDKENYFIALQFADVGNIEAFIEYIAINLNQSLGIMIGGAKGSSIEEPDDIDKEVALLEIKLQGAGLDLKSKQHQYIQSIYGGIRNCAFEIMQKMSKFQAHYLNKSVLIRYKGIEFQYNKAPQTISEIDDLKIIVNFNTIKKQGLDNFRFYYEIGFEFGTIYYKVFEQTPGGQRHIFKKNYDDLSEEEIRILVASVIKAHNQQLESALSK